MSASVIIVVELDAEVAPPAADSVRQLLALIDSLPTQGGELDWRLVSLTVNSPLRAELQAFAGDGESVSDARMIEAAQSGFEVLEALTDIGARARPLVRMAPADRERLKALIVPLKGRTGRVQITLPGGPEYTITADKAETTLEEIGRLHREASRRLPPPAPELGSVEGHITEATTYYGKPALKVRRHLSEDVVTCVFDAAVVSDIGGNHTLAEVWAGRRVCVSGKLVFGEDGRLMQVRATDLVTLTAPTDVLHLLREASDRGEVAEPLAEWNGDA